MKRTLKFALVALFGLLATNAYGQGGCMHHGGGSSMGMGSMGMGMGSGMGGISSTVQNAYMHNQYAQQQFMRQMYMQQQYEQQQTAARQAERAARRADKVVMLKQRRETELAKKNSAKVKASTIPETKNLSELILAGKK